MIKAIMIIWIGLSHSKTNVTTQFETMEKCLAVKQALKKHNKILEATCIPYVFGDETWVSE